MADVSNLNLNGVNYTIKDSVARSSLGGPNVAATKSAMTDRTKVYVYTGTESGMTKGNWYYHNGSAWVSGGVYQSTAVETDTSLTRSGVAADSKTVGDRLDEVNNISGLIDEFGILLNKENISVSKRAVFYPVNFKRGKRYKICIQGSDTPLYLIRVSKIAGISAPDTLATWVFSYSDTRGTEINYDCVDDDARYIGIIMTSDVTSFSFTKLYVYGWPYTETESRLDTYGVLFAKRKCVSTPTSRSVTIPMAFERGKTYHIIVSNPSASLQEVRVSTGSNLNTAAIIQHWPLDPLTGGEVYYKCTEQHALFLIVVATSDVSGFYFDIEVYSNKIVDLETKINSIQTNTEKIPDYYFTDGYLDNKIADIKDNNNFLHGCSFAFITDLHFQANVGNSKLLLKEVLDKTTIPFVICGGDIAPAYGTDALLKQTAEKIVEYENTVGKDRFFSVPGNHDFRIKADSSVATGTKYTNAARYNYLQRNQELHHSLGYLSSLTWYLDIPSQSTRIVGLNTSDYLDSDDFNASIQVGTNQLNWLINTVLTKQNYNYVFISHVPLDPMVWSNVTTYASLTALYDLLTAFRNKTTFTYDTLSADFSSSTSNTICLISGHVHRDASNTGLNLLNIATTCDAYYKEDGYNAAAGTITEHAFDVFSIDYDSKTIKAVRIGRGSDRQWTFN